VLLAKFRPGHLTPRIFSDPDDPADVIDYLDALLEAPAVLLTGSPTTWRGF